MKKILTSKANKQTNMSSANGLSLKKIFATRNLLTGGLAAVGSILMRGGAAGGVDLMGDVVLVALPGIVGANVATALGSDVSGMLKSKTADMVADSAIAGISAVAMLALMGQATFDLSAANVELLALYGVSYAVASAIMKSDSN